MPVHYKYRRGGKGGGFTMPVTMPLPASTMLYHSTSVGVPDTMVNVGRAMVEHW